MLAVCARGLQCRAGVCKFPFARLGEKCAVRNGLDCKSPLVCAGKPHNRRCVRPMPQGGKCANDPWWVCADGLVCEQGVCAKQRKNIGERCDVHAPCAKALLCAGNGKRNKCVKGMPPGGKCGNDPWWVCEKGTKCEHGTCKVPMHGRCERAQPCVQGLVCAGTENVRKCVKPMAPGEKCGNDPWWVCDSDALCRNGICQRVYLTDVLV